MPGEIVKGDLRRMLLRCSSCLQRPESKFAHTTWAWSRADGVRVAWRQRLCAGCFAQHVLPLDKPRAPEDRLSCPSCGIDTEDDFDAIYVTAFIPGFGPTRYEFPMCAADAAHVRLWIIEHATELEDGNVASRGQAPSTPTPVAEAWRGLGIVPRDVA